MVVIPEQATGAVLGDDPVDVAAGGDDAGAPGGRAGTMRANVPPPAVEGSAMIGRPPSESAAPRTRSIWPPMLVHHLRPASHSSTAATSS